MENYDIERIIRRTWGNNIRSLRRKNDLTQCELALLFNPPVVQATIARWETGTAEPRIRHKIEMARIFEMPASMMFPLMDAVAA